MRLVATVFPSCQEVLLDSTGLHCKTLPEGGGQICLVYHIYPVPEKMPAHGKVFWFFLGRKGGREGLIPSFDLLNKSLREAGKKKNDFPFFCR